MHVLALLLSPMTALHCAVCVIGDKEQKVYHQKDFPGMFLKPRFPELLNRFRNY